MISSRLRFESSRATEFVDLTKLLDLREGLDMGEEGGNE